MGINGDGFVEKRMLVHLGIIGAAIVLILVISVTGIPLLNNAPVTSMCSPHGSSGNIVFTSDVYGTEDSLSFQYTPKDEMPATVYTTYEVCEYGSPIITEHNKVYTSIAPANPIVINVSRQRNATYTVNMSIWKKDESCPVYQSRVSIATGHVK